MNKILKEAVVLLIIVAMVFSSVAVTANTADEQISSASGRINENIVSKPQTKENILMSFSNDRTELFKQEPQGPIDPGANCYTSDANLGYLVYDNYWNIDGEICDIHWWGFTMYWNSGWYPCDPTGMTFDINFYTDYYGEPGTLVCSYTNVQYSISGTGVFYTWGSYSHELYYFEAFLTPCCNLQNGWVSIQSTYSPNGCAFLWMNSIDGDLYCLQDTTIRYYDVSFILTGGHPPTAPVIIGPNKGNPNEQKTFKFQSTDPDGGNLQYIIEWGDGSPTETTNWFPAGSPVEVTHTYTQSGQYTIKARARDEDGYLGPEGTKLYVCPRDKTIDKPILNLLQSHPNLFPILQKIIQKLEL